MSVLLVLLRWGGVLKQVFYAMVTKKTLTIHNTQHIQVRVPAILLYFLLIQIF